MTKASTDGNEQLEDLLNVQTLFIAWLLGHLVCKGFKETLEFNAVAAKLSTK